MLSLAREKGNERTVRESEIIGWGISETYFSNGSWGFCLSYGKDKSILVVGRLCVF